MINIIRKTGTFFNSFKITNRTLMAKAFSFLLTVLLIVAIAGCAPKENVFVKTSGNIIPRVHHTATLLPNGNVLIAGGMDNQFEALRKLQGHWGSDTAEIYNPKTGKFSLTGKMVEKRNNPQSVLLPNGKVLIVDGVAENKRTTSKIKSAELYDYKTGKFTKTGDLNYQRIMGHTLTLLRDGRVLVVGGLTKHQKYNIPCEIYDYRTGMFRVTSPMHYYNRAFHTATLLKDGNVLISGGDRISGSINNFPNAEVFDPKTEKFTKVGKPIYKRKYASAVLLNNGKVLVIGGGGYAQKEVILTDKKSLECNRDKKTGKYYTVNRPAGLYELNNAEIYNPATKKFEKLIETNFRRKEFTAIKLLNGKVLIVGNSDNTYEELYDPAINKFIKIDSVGYTRGHNTLTLLQNGDVLIVGGINRHRYWVHNLLFRTKEE